MHRTILQKAATLSGGRPTMPHEATRSVLRYSPTPRRPYAPAQVQRQNLLLTDLEKEWNSSRGKQGPGHVNSGYTKKTEIQYEDTKIPLTPVHELNKFMPDITVPGIQATPVSLMHARNGHRISHDLIHSYDPKINELEKYPTQPRRIDHDAVTPYDEMRFGLHPQAIGSRSRIYRYLRRSPFMEEKTYYRNYVLTSPVPKEENERREQLIAHATADDIENACEEYRKLLHPPSREVFLALMQCCERLGLLADAVALFDDGYTIDRRMVRDPEILSSYLNTALGQTHAACVMRIMSYIIGSRTDNRILRSEIPDEWKSRFGRRVLRWYLDHGYSCEARNVYDWMASTRRPLIHYDAYDRMAAELAVTLQQDTNRTSPEQKKENRQTSDAETYDTTVERFTEKGILALLTQYHAQYCFLEGVGGSFSIAWLRKVFDVDLDFVVRLRTHFYDMRLRKEVAVDNLAKVDLVRRIHSDLIQLCPGASRPSNHVLLPYLRKSKVSKNNPNIRIVPHVGEMERLQTTPTHEGFTFGYSLGTRYVAESYPVLSSGNVQQMYVGRSPTQTEVAIEVWHRDEPVSMGALAQNHSD